MDENIRYEQFLRTRITKLREQRNISEHRLSLELGKSGSYIRSITSGLTLPSVRELFKGRPGNFFGNFKDFALAFSGISYCLITHQAPCLQRPSRETA